VITHGDTLVAKLLARTVSWTKSVYKPIPRVSVRLAMVRPAGPVRPVVDAFLAVARKTAAKHHP
jgi:hypothetical protein